MLDWSSCPAVERDPDRISGAWVFRGTRVPVKALFENLESGARIDDFLSWFPGVYREMRKPPKLPLSQIEAFGENIDYSQETRRKCRYRRMSSKSSVFRVITVAPTEWAVRAINTSKDSSWIFRFS
ncbi:MAG TPA: DUF433 domain-containing protein [Candidatus Binatia bacterium]|jgi:uncharacterized protein (DUF433 family)